ncbi:MAG TPA: hypothetical protein VJ783_11025 [Pirellulales bacterium]|nr:hypothetical protein [Pirellulales bacterium]
MTTTQIQPFARECHFIGSADAVWIRANVGLPNCAKTAAAGHKDRDYQRSRDFKSKIQNPKSKIGWATFLGALLIASSARAQPAAHDGFESPEPSWRVAPGDQYRIELHERASQGAHSGDSCEHLRLRPGANGALRISLVIPHARIIPELMPTLWVRADRARPRLLARVVFPHALDPRTGKPLSHLLAGASYDEVGKWQQLRLDNTVKLVAQVVRPLRAQYGRQLDMSEAYLDRLVLEIEPSVAPTNIWIDDLDLRGLVTTDQDHAASQTGVKPPVAGVVGRHRIELSGPVLLVDGSPFFPRMIEYQGEPLAYLKELRFNAVKLSSPPSDALLEEALRAAIWLVCPPPRAAATDALREFDGRYEPVLAWFLGQGLTAAELEAMRQWAEQVRHADRRVGRPLVCDPMEELAQYSRIPGVQILMTHRSPLGGSFELADYETWLRERPRLALPGLALWTTIQTQHSRELIEQMRLLSDGQSPEPAAELEQLRLMVQAALAAGARGLAFASQSPLDAQDAATRMRAAALQLINLEQELVQPWVAASTASIGAGGLDESGDNPGVAGAALQSGRSRLLLPYWAGTGAQYVTDQVAGNDLAFVVPGIPEASSAYEITAGGLRPLTRRRGLGGLHVKLQEFGVTARVLLTDEAGISAVSRRLLTIGPKAARLERDLAAARLNHVAGTHQQLARLADRVADADMWLSQARTELASADKNLERSDWPAACLAAHRATRSLRLLERTHWEKATTTLGSPIASPLAVSFATLPYHWQFARALESRPHSRNRLLLGNMESLPRMWKSGWRLFQHSQPTVRGVGDLSIEDRHAGKASFHLSVEPSDEENPAPMIETTPLWLTSPPLRVEAGQWVRIHGWVNIPEPITGSLDGLLIIESLGREPLAERIGVTSGWREFTLYRAAPSACDLTVTFALTGIGDAWIDDVTIELIAPPGRQAVARGR